MKYLTSRHAQSFWKLGGHVWESAPPLIHIGPPPNLEYELQTSLALCMPAMNAHRAWQVTETPRTKLGAHTKKSIFGALWEPLVDSIQIDSEASNCGHL